jgi:WD40 repeat protein
MRHRPISLKCPIFIAIAICTIFLFGCQLSILNPDLTTSPLSGSTATLETSVVTSPLETIISLATPSLITPHESTPTAEVVNDKQLILKKTFDFYGPFFALSPDGNIFAASYPDSVFTFTSQNAGRVAEFPKPKASLMGGGSVAFSPDGKKLAAEVNVEGKHGTESEFYLLDSTSLELLERHAFNGIMTDMQYSPDGMFVAGTGSERGRIYLWNIKTKGVTLLKSAADHLAFSPVNPILASGETVSQGGPAVKLWNLKDFTSQEIFELEVDPNSYYSGRTTSVSFSPDGHLLAAVINGKLRFWDIIANKEVISSLNTSDSLVKAIYSNKGYLATLDQNGEITVYDPNTGNVLGTTVIKGIEDPIYFELSFSMLFSPDGEQLLTGAYDVPIQIWEIP